MEARQRSPLFHHLIIMMSDMYHSTISSIYVVTMDPESITDSNKSFVSFFTPKLLSLMTLIRRKTTGPGRVSFLLLVVSFVRS